MPVRNALRAHTCNPLSPTTPLCRAQINFATLVIAFFATSAIFHFWALVAGAYEHSEQARLEPNTHTRIHALTFVPSCLAQWFWYWRQMDDALRTGVGPR